MTPHKCPCCDGWGTRHHRSGDANFGAQEEIDCPSCDDGVVWWSDEPDETGPISGKEFLEKADALSEETARAILEFQGSGTSATWTCGECGRQCSSDGAHQCTHVTYGPVYTT